MSTHAGQASTRAPSTNAIGSTTGGPATRDTKSAPKTDQVTITVSRKALNTAIAALENLGDTHPWTASEYDDPADEITRALKTARKQE